MIRVLLVLALCIALQPVPSLAARKGSVTPENREFTVHVPRTELALSPEAERLAAHERPAAEIAASSWQPREYRRSGYSGQSSQFHRGSVPLSAVSVGLPLSSHRNGAALYAKLGLSFTQLEREEAGLIRPQTLYLFSARTGLEYQGLRLFGFLHPSLGFSVLPTYAVATASLVEGAVNDFGLPLEATAGLLLRPGFLKEFWGFQNGALAVEAQRIFGTVGGSKLDGSGLQARFQVSM
jgi:hypothetical protein